MGRNRVGPPVRGGQRAEVAVRWPDDNRRVATGPGLATNAPGRGSALRAWRIYDAGSNATG
jgi:hypothetical protein